jgi:hypothetical protein
MCVDAPMRRAVDVEHCWDVYAVGFAQRQHPLSIFMFAVRIGASASIGTLLLFS